MKKQLITLSQVNRLIKEVDILYANTGHRSKQVEKAYGMAKATLTTVHEKVLEHTLEHVRTKPKKGENHEASNT